LRSCRPLRQVSDDKVLAARTGNGQDGSERAEAPGILFALDAAEGNRPARLPSLPLRQGPSLTGPLGIARARALALAPAAPRPRPAVAPASHDALRFLLTQFLQDFVEPLVRQGRFLLDQPLAACLVE